MALSVAERSRRFRQRHKVVTIRADRIVASNTTSDNVASNEDLRNAIMSADAYAVAAARIHRIDPKLAYKLNALAISLHRDLADVASNEDLLKENERLRGEIERLKAQAENDEEGIALLEVNYDATVVYYKEREATYKKLVDAYEDQLANYKEWTGRS